MIYTIKKNKNLIISSSILAVINCNNIYCGCLCDDNKTNTGTNNNNGNNTGDGKDKKDETPNGDEGKKKPTPEEIEKNRQNIVNKLMYLFNDKKKKLEEAGRQNELKITEQQIKNVNNDIEIQNIFNELNNIKIHNDPVKDVILDVDNIPDVSYIYKVNTKDNLKSNNFIKYINDDINEDNIQKNNQIIEKLFEENKLYRFIKYDPSMFRKNEKNELVPNNDYLVNNMYLLYIDKDTFNIKDGVNLGEITYLKINNKIVLNSKYFENCYFLFTTLAKAEDKVTVFKRKQLSI